jgi:hypothetical protein
MFNLPTMADVNATRRATPKGSEPSRLEIKAAKKVDDKREWERAKKEVWARDQSRDRLTKRKVIKTLELHPRRGEVHHLEPRENKALRYDRRNLILLSLETHERVTKHELAIVGTRFFTHEGKQHIDADYRVRFVKP